MRTVVFSMVVALVLCSGVPGARADEGQEQQAKIQFAQGVALYEEGRVDQAAIAFARAYELRPHYRILWNIGQVENDQGHYAAALDAYTRYLEEGGEEVPVDRAAIASKEIMRLKALVGSIMIETDEEGLIVLIDKEERGRTPLQAPIFVDLGRHEVVLERGREALLERVVTVAGGQYVEVELVGDGAAEAGPRAEAGSAGEEGDGEDDGKAQVILIESIGGDDAPASEVERPRIWTVVSFAVGAAALVGAGVTGGLAYSKKDLLDKSETCEQNICTSIEDKELKDTGTTLGTVTDVLVGVFAAGFVAGVALYFLEPRIGANDDDGVTVAPTAMNGGAGVAVGGRF